MTWDGQERRKGTSVSTEDHDLLTRMDVNVNNLLEKFDTHIKTSNDIHKNLDNRVSFHDKIIWGGLGILAFLQIIFKAIK